MSWTDYLPPILQVNTLYWTMGICVAAVCFLKKVPSVQPWQMQVLVFLIASMNTIPLMRDSFVYAFGTAFICSSISTSFYDAFCDAAIKWITKKLVALGYLSPPVNPNPLTLPTNEK